ncbi:MAG: FecR domain-containing protein [Lewinellaceae bacterium]|nr:FecR domain-containing protein [Saprospiraceae bacterium]MCB9337566.1 FecR domain-containing protein [Lewinellaceae bacterium]
MLNDELLHKWINGELTAVELETFRQRPEYSSLVELYKNTEGLAAPAFDQEAMLSHILKKEKISATPEKTGRRVFLTWAKYAAAACVLLIAGWFLFSFFGKNVRYEMAKGETKEGVLPDQSMFVLNAESTLHYNKSAWKKERTLELEGEAFFSVKPGSTFTVKTPSGSVQVLGTKFNVWSRDGALDVKCSHGIVAVYDTSGELVTKLKQYDAVRLVPGRDPEPYQIPGEDNASWTQGITKLRKVPLAVVLQELERQFDVEIVADGLDDKEIITCNFQHEDLALALQTALSPLGIRFEIKGRKVVLKK